MLQKRDVTPEKLAEVANRIMHPYTVDIKHVSWWSVFEIGRRLCEKFDDVPVNETRLPRVFIAGDACHSHSQREGREGDEGVDGRRLEPWLEAASVLRGVANGTSSRRAASRPVWRRGTPPR